MKKIVAMLLCVILVLSVFAGCSSNKGSTAQDTTAAADTTAAGETTGEDTTAEETSDEVITLTWVGAGWAANDKAKNCIAKWEEQNPNIKVNYIELGSAVDTEYLKNLDVMVAAGETVDITYLGIGDLYNRVLNGGAQEISTQIAASGDDFEAMYGGLATTMLTYNDEVYGVPYCNNTFKVFYNKTMVEEAGITIPETWTLEEFTEIAKQVDAANGDAYGCIFPSTWSDLCYAAAQVAGWTLVTTDESGAVVPNFEDETFQSVLQWVKDLADVDGVSPSYATIKSESLNRRMALANGQTAMIVDGPYTLVWMNNYMFNDPGEGALSFELGVAELPVATEEAKNVSFESLVGAFYVPKSAKYAAEAYEFAKFICNECLIESACYMPTYTEANMEDATQSLRTFVDTNGDVHEDIYAQEVAEKAVTCPGESHLAYWNYDPSMAAYTSLMTTLFDEQYTLFLTGEMDMAEWSAYMQDLGATEIANAN